MAYPTVASRVWPISTSLPNHLRIMAHTRWAIASDAPKSISVPGGREWRLWWSAGCVCGSHANRHSIIAIVHICHSCLPFRNSPRVYKNKSLRARQGDCIGTKHPIWFCWNFHLTPSPFEKRLNPAPERSIRTRRQLTTQCLSPEFGECHRLVTRLW